MRSFISLNGKKSSLELLFLVNQKLIQEKIKNGKKGIKFGSERISYEDCMKELYKLHSVLGLKGCFSFGICETCNNFQGFSEEISGKCRRYNKTVYFLDSCEEHSKSGGGFGL